MLICHYTYVFVYYKVKFFSLSVFPRVNLTLELVSI